MSKKDRKRWAVFYDSNRFGEWVKIYGTRQAALNFAETHGQLDEGNETAESLLLAFRNGDHTFSIDLYPGDVVLEGYDGETHLQSRKGS